MTVERIVIGCELHPKVTVADYRRAVQDGRALWVEVPSPGGRAEQWKTEQTDADGVIVTEGERTRAVWVCRKCRQPVPVRDDRLASVLRLIVADGEPVDGVLAVTLQRVRKLIMENLGR